MNSTILSSKVDNKDKQLRIGLAGLGNVGAGVYKNLHKINSC